MVANSYKLIQLGLPFDLNDLDWSTSDGLRVDSVELEIIDLSQSGATFGSSFGTTGAFEILTTKDNHTYLYNYVGNSATVDLSNAMYDIYDGLFYNNRTVQNVIWPSNFTAVKNIMFKYAYNLRSIELPDTVTSIGEYAFANLPYFTSINLGQLSNLTSIGEYAFDLCTQLSKIVIPSGVTVIEAYTFRGNFSITAITLHNQLQRIEAYAFQAVPLPEGFAIPDSVIYIDVNAFRECTLDGEPYNPPFTGNRDESSASVLTARSSQQQNTHTQNANLGLINSILFGA